MALKNLSIISGSHRSVSLVCSLRSLSHDDIWSSASSFRGLSLQFLLGCRRPLLLSAVASAGAGLEGTVVVLWSVWGIDGTAPFSSKAALHSGVPVC